MTDPRSRHAGLVDELCHELGNLLLAARLSADVIAREGPVEDLPALARQLESTLVWAGELTALVPPLLVGPREQPGGLAPQDLVDAAVRGLAPRVRASLHLACEAPLPAVRADAEALQHLLVALLQQAGEAGEAGAGVSLEMCADASAVVFRVAGRGAWPKPPRTSDLLSRVADALLRPVGGRAQRAAGAVPCVTLRLALASRPSP